MTKCEYSEARQRIQRYKALDDRKHQVQEIINNGALTVLNGRGSIHFDVDSVGYKALKQALEGEISRLEKYMEEI